MTLPTESDMTELFNTDVREAILKLEIEKLIDSPYR
jgi:DNA-binding FadR family transcriptional regulator